MNLKDPATRFFFIGGITLLIAAACAWIEWTGVGFFTASLDSSGQSWLQRRSNESSEDPSEIPLVWFRREDPSFAREVSFAPFRDWPTPKLIGETEYATRAGFDNYSHPLTSWLYGHLPVRLAPRRRGQQPEQFLRFSSHERSAHLGLILDAHLSAHGFALHNGEFDGWEHRFSQIRQGRFIRNDGLEFHPPPKDFVWTAAYQPNPHPGYNPANRVFSPHWLSICFTESGDGTTQVEISATEYRYNFH